MLADQLGFWSSNGGVVGWGGVGSGGSTGLRHAWLNIQLIAKMSQYISRFADSLNNHFSRWVVHPFDLFRAPSNLAEHATGKDWGEGTNGKGSEKRTPTWKYLAHTKLIETTLMAFILSVAFQPDDEGSRALYESFEKVVMSSFGGPNGVNDTCSPEQ